LKHRGTEEAEEQEDQGKKQKSKLPKMKIKKALKCARTEGWRLEG
jgi:hypothetical protein